MLYEALTPKQLRAEFSQGKTADLQGRQRASYNNTK